MYVGIIIQDNFIFLGRFKLAEDCMTSLSVSNPMVFIRSLAHFSLFPFEEFNYVSTFI